MYKYLGTYTQVWPSSKQEALHGGQGSATMPAITELLRVFKKMHKLKKKTLYIVIKRVTFAKFEVFQVDFI